MFVVVVGSSLSQYVGAGALSKIAFAFFIDLFYFNSLAYCVPDQRPEPDLKRIGFKISY
jgi:hypothetical protein